MTLRPGEHPDELISASLSGDLTPAERADLDTHLAGCERCRATLDAFRAERQAVAGLPRSQPPADLGARIRAGIESGAGLVPWWRRPSTLVGTVATLATVAAALLVVVVVGNLARGPVGATSSPAPSGSETVSAAPTATTAPSEPAETPGPSVAPLPTIGPNPVGQLEYRLADQQASLTVTTDAGTQEVAVQRYGLPVNASLSPTTDWLAFQLLGDGSGLVDTYAVRLADGALIPLFEGAADSPFALLSWSADGSLLAFTGLSDDGQNADAWVFSTLDPEAGARQLTNTGRSFAAGFDGCCVDNQAWLWVSTAAEGPASTDRVAVPLDGSLIGPVDPATASLKRWDGIFLPVANGATQPGEPMRAAWDGEMSLDAGGWHFARGGMLYVAGTNVEGDFADGPGQPLFDTLAIANGGEAFRSARFAWAPDGDGLAVWDAQWQGVPQPEGFPDQTRVYYAHPPRGILIGPDQALDAADTGGGSVVNVALGGGPYLALTVQTAEGSEGGTYGPTAELRIVTRNTGATPDDVTTRAQDRAWIGPAFYPAAVSPD